MLRLKEFSSHQRRVWYCKVHSSNQLSDVQKQLKELLGEFDTICRERNLRYCICGGTILGAVRHAGFIPWDDDVDVVMPGIDYERLLKCTDLPEKYRVYKRKALFGCFENQTIPITHGDTEWDKREPYLSLDIFPLYGAPENKLLRNIHIAHSLFYFIIIKLKDIDYIKNTEKLKNRKDRPAKEKLMIQFGKVLSALVKPLSEKMLTDKFYKVSGKYEFDSSRIVGSYCGRYRFKDFYYRKVIEPGKNVAFEDITVRGMNQPEIYLQQIYGEDYMLLPPTEKRERHGSLQLSNNKAQ